MADYDFDDDRSADSGDEVYDEYKEGDDNEVGNYDDEEETEFVADGNLDDAGEALKTLEENAQDDDRESLLTKMRKILEKEKKERLKLEIALQREVGALNTGEERFNPWHKGYDIGNVVKYEVATMDKKGALKKGIITRFNKDFVYVVDMKESNVENAKAVSYNAIKAVEELGRPIAKEEEYSIDGQVIQWRELRGKKLSNFIDAMIKKDKYNREQKKTLVLKTDELNIAEIYGSKPESNPFNVGYNIGRRVRIDHGTFQTWGYITDYDEKTVTVRERIGGSDDKYAMKTYDDVSAISFFPDSRVSYQKINRGLLLQKKIGESIRGLLAGPDIPEIDLFTEIRKIVYRKWQNKLAGIFPAEKAEPLSIIRNSFVSLSDAELYNSGSDFENWVLLAKKDALDDMYYEIHGKRLFEAIKRKESILEKTRSTMETQFEKILAEIFESYYSDTKVFVEEMVKILDSYHGDDNLYAQKIKDPEGAIITLKDKFDQDYIAEIENLGGALIEHPYSQALFEVIQERNPDVEEGALINNINSVFVLEKLAYKYTHLIKNEPLIGLEKFTDQVGREKLAFVRWIYRNTIGAIESEPKYERARREIHSGLNREEKIWATYYSILMAEYMDQVPPTPFRNHSIIQSLEKLLDSAKEQSYTIKEYLERVLCMYTLLSEPFVSPNGKGICNYLQEKVVRRGQAIWDFRVDSKTGELKIEHLLPEIFYASSIAEPIKNLTRNIFKVHLEQAIDEVLFDIPFFKFPRGDKIRYSHALALKKIVGVYATPVDRCIADTNTGVQPIGDSSKPWTKDDMEGANLERIPPEDIILCVHDGKFYCYSEKALVIQFLQNNYISKYTGKAFDQDFVKAVLEPHLGEPKNNKHTEMYGVIGESIQKVAKEHGGNPKDYTNHFNALSIAKHYIYIKGDDSIDLLKTRLPPTPKVVILTRLSTPGKAEANRLIQKMLGKIEVIFN